MASPDPSEPDTARLRVVRALQIVLAVLGVFFLFIAIDASRVSLEASNGLDGGITACPPVIKSIGHDLTAECRAEVNHVARGIALFSVVAVGSLIGILLAERHRRRLVWAARYAPPPTTADAWTHENVRWEFWVALTFVGLMALAGVLSVAFVIPLGDLERRNVMGVLLWLFVAIAILRYGRTRAYRIEIVDHELRWSAPLRTRTVPLTSLRRGEVFFRTTYLGGEGVAHLRTTSGEDLAVRPLSVRVG